ncbi:SRPBCC family protein [Amylibacter sp. IMCC11727]|uniref:SRPBCC family protein n=1 Tax=Amylibacter sp. IMCC11727 TaxID=3039851 RepID=UPI00244E347B|nr:SRPBCC family protein [Amylibacter sp. IMCC11727]WGI21479.1 SRPBCC family protein [Amylibacter sp. IMCC11727]
MQFSSVQDVNAPLDFVFQQLSDFESYESYALRTGADVERIDTFTEKCAGMQWKIQGDFRGKRRKFNIELIEYRPDNLLKFFVKSAGVEANATMESMALTRKQSRIKVTTVLKPKTISARLILQSAKLAKNSMNRKFNHRFWTYANFIENNYNKSR